MASLWMQHYHTIGAMQRRSKLSNGVDWSWATVSADLAAVTAVATSGQTSYTAETIDALPSGFGLYGAACLLMDGRMLILPSALPGTIYLHDTVEDTYTPIVISTGSTKYPAAAFLLPSGKVIIMCHHAYGRTADVLFDPTTNACTDVIDQWYHTAGLPYLSGQLYFKEPLGITHDGMVLFSYKTGASAPYTKTLAIWDPINNIGTTHSLNGYSDTANWAYTHPAELPDGRIFVCSRGSGYYDLICNRDTGALEQVTFISNSNAYKYASQCTALPDATVFRPGASVTNNPRMNFVANTAAYPLYIAAAQVATLLPSNAVVTGRCGPSLTLNAYLLRLGLNTKQVLSVLGTACTRGILAPNGKIYWFPRDAASSDAPKRWDGLFSQNFSLNSLVSPWLNAGF